LAQWLSAERREQMVDSWGFEISSPAVARRTDSSRRPLGAVAVSIFV
jgi:hypothetical protein